MSRRFQFIAKALIQPVGWKADLLAGALISIASCPFMGFSSAKTTVQAMAFGVVLWGFYVGMLDIVLRWFHRHFK